MTRSPGGPLRWWDVVTATVLLLALVFVLADRTADRVSVGVAVCLLGALAVSYLVLGRPALHRVRLHARPGGGGWLFLGLLVALVGAATATEPSLATLQIVAYPLVWSIADRYVVAVCWNIGLSLAVAAGLVLSYARMGILEGRVLDVAVVAALSLAFSLAMGTWITQIFERGEQHRRLAEQLHAAQAEVAALSAAAGAAEERERMSRELHDTLTQTLTGVVMLADQTKHALDAEDLPRAQERLDRVRAAAREAMGEARALVASTQPLRDGELVGALTRLAERLSADTGLDVRCAATPVAVNRERAVVLLRAAQEGTANARRHARARRIDVRLREESGVAVLTIDDNGVGPGAAAQAPEGEASEALAVSSGFGLPGLSDRVRLVGGDVTFGARAEGGSRLEVRVPLGGGAAASDAEEGE